MPRKSIAVIGPVPPYRGGIAHHTGRVAEALAEVADVNVFSFSRLYPGWLYPGKFQREGDPVETANGPSFTLDALNPWSWSRTANRIERLRPDAVVIPWWTFFLAPCFRYLARRLAGRGIAVIFFCHNVVDHEAASWKRFLSGWVLRQGSGFVVQTREEQGKLRELVAQGEIVFHPHPIYDQFPEPKGNLPRRAALELLFYGFIRPYKGLDVLIDAMSGLRDADVFLSIVGEPWAGHEKEWRERIKASGASGKIQFLPRYINDEETAEFFCRADAVVLPYRAATGTGVVATAYHYDKPVIASDIASFRDVVTDGKSGVLFECGNAVALEAAIRRIAAADIARLAAGIAQHKAAMSWRSMADALLSSIATRS
jgi:glycosyltransferase involved in cell wall biosynthesis